MFRRSEAPYLLTFPTQKSSGTRCKNYTDAIKTLHHPHQKLSWRFLTDQRAHVTPLYLHKLPVCCAGHASSLLRDTRDAQTGLRRSPNGSWFSFVGASFYLIKRPSECAVACCGPARSTAFPRPVARCKTSQGECRKTGNRSRLRLLHWPYLDLRSLTVSCPEESAHG